MGYVDGFLIPIPRKKLSAYRALARKACKIWMDLGALEYRECVGEDLAGKKVVTFPRTVKAKRGETVVLAWVVYKSRRHRDAVNARIMKDPRILKMMTMKSPFDPKRMVYGGFEIIVSN